MLPQTPLRHSEQQHIVTLGTPGDNPSWGYLPTCTGERGRNQNQNRLTLLLVIAAKDSFENLLYLNRSAASREHETRKETPLGGRCITDTDAKPTRMLLTLYSHLLCLKTLSWRMGRAGWGDPLTAKLDLFFPKVYPIHPL